MYERRGSRTAAMPASSVNAKQNSIMDCRYRQKRQWAAVEAQRVVRGWRARRKVARLLEDAVALQMLQVRSVCLHVRLRRGGKAMLHHSRT